MKRFFIVIIFLLACALAGAQDNNTRTVAPGSSIPGLGGLPGGLDGPGYLEFGGSHSGLSDSPSWNDFYARGMVSGGRNTFNGQLWRQSRFGDSGWFYDLGLVRTLSPNWYADISAGSSFGGFFLPKFRTDALINRKLLARKQLVATGGIGYDKSKTVNSAFRYEFGGAYYFEYPVVLQGGVTFTHANPGAVLARTQYIAATQGHAKEHFVSLRYEWGREGYEIVAPFNNPGAPFDVLFDFPERTLTGTWRQWVGPNWGLNFNLEHHKEPAYTRTGGSIGVFLDF